MDKNINDNDRIVIGVREWAFKTVLSDPYCGQNWEEDRVGRDEAKKRTTESLLGTAAKLEEFVLRDIGNSVTEIQTRPPYIWEKGFKEIKD